MDGLYGTEYINDKALYYKKFHYIHLGLARLASYIPFITKLKEDLKKNNPQISKHTQK